MRGERNRCTRADETSEIVGYDSCLDPVAGDFTHEQSEMPNRRRTQSHWPGLNAIQAVDMLRLKDSVPPQCVYHHKDKPIERNWWRSPIIIAFCVVAARNEWLIWEEAGREDPRREKKARAHGYT